MKVKDRFTYAIQLGCLFGFFQLLFVYQVAGQCSIHTIPNTTIYCGNSIQLSTIFDWQNKSIGGGNIYFNASWFSSVDTGYEATYDGGIKKTINGGQTWATLSTGNTEPIFSLYFVNDSVGYAAGGNWGSSFLLKTMNGGISWSKSIPTSLGTIKSIFFPTTDTGFAVGGDDLNGGYYIIKTHNGGNSWNKLDSGGGFTLLSVQFVNPSVGYAAGSNGKILKTINGGTSWSILSSGVTTHLKQVYFIDANNGYAIVSNVLLITSNGGLTWSQKTFSSNLSFVGVYFSDVLNGHLIDGYMHLKTTDGGLSWKESTIGGSQPLTNAFFLNAQTAYVSGLASNIRKYQLPISYSWSPSTHLSNASIESPFAFPKDSTTYIVSATFPGSCIARDTVTIGVMPVFLNLKQNQTVQCGTALNLEILSSSFDNSVPLNYKWWPGITLNDSTIERPLARPIADSKYYVSITASNGCSITDSTLVFVTPMEVSAGSNRMITCGDSILLSGAPKWNVQSNTYSIVTSMYFTSCETGYAVGNGIQKTTDGGKTWVIKSFTSGMQSVFFYNSSVGYAVGDYATLLKTTNGGNSWQSYSAGSTNLRAVFFASIDTGYVVGVTGTIRRTINGGLTWSNQSLPTLISFNKVFFLSSTTGFVIGNNGLLYKTSNAGVNWTLVPTGTTNNLLDICKSGSNTIHIIGSNRTYIKSLDGGLNWIVNTNASFWNPKSIVFTNALQGFIAGNVGAVGAIYSTEDGGNSWSLQDYRDFSDINSICFPSPSCGYAYGQGMTNKFLMYEGMADTYTWTPSIGLRNTQAAQTYAYPIASTNYNLTITKSGCTASSSVAIQVNPLRIVNLPNYLYDPSFVCGTIFQMDTITTNDTNGVINYLWSPPAFFNNPQSNHPTIKLMESKYYHLLAETWNGCMATDSVHIYTQAFTVEAGTDIYRNYNHLCGSTYQLDSIKTNTIENNLTYRWYPSTNMNDTTILNPRVTLKDDIIYHVIVTTPNGCMGHDSVKLEPFPLEIYHGNNKDAYCGMATQLDSVRTNQNSFGPYTYTWFPSIGLNQITIPNPITTMSNIGYKVTVSNKVGCVATDSVYVTLTKMLAPELCIVSVDSNNKNLLVWDIPPTLAVDSYYVYRETNVNGQYNKIASLPFQLHNYFIDNASFPDVQSNKYKISLVDSCGFETSTGAAHKTMHLTINKGLGNSWNLIWNFYEGFNASTYNIYRGTDSMSLMQIGTTAGSNNSYTDLTAPIGDVYYQVEIVSPRSCALQKNINSSRSNKTSNRIIGLPFVYKEMNFLLYPNPVSDNLTIEWQNAEEHVEVSVYSIEGKLVLQRPLTPQSNTLNMSAFQNGLYVVEVRSELGMGRKLLLK
jgi:photosystem II stability/assembly factor-like uncharacterized protein